MESRRLDKHIADSISISRKDAKALIRRGLVLVNGQPASSPEAKIGPDDKVMAQGKLLPALGHSYIMLNKPTGVVCSTRDPRSPTVLDLLPETMRCKGLFPAGRLDKDTEGFVLITDDGGFAHRILAPRSHVPKTYRARLDGPVEESLLVPAFAQGLPLDGGDITSPAHLTVLENGREYQIELVIYEGMYHQVKRMFARFSLEVLYLRRVAIGGLFLDETLALGEARAISPEELRLILGD